MFLRLTVHCIATKFRNSGKANERKLKEYNFLIVRLLSPLTGTVLSFGKFSNNTAFRARELSQHTSKSHWRGNNIKYNRNILCV